MGWTQKDYADYLKRRGVPGQPNTADVSKPPFRAPAHLAHYALGRLKTGQMNKTEAAYAEHLKLLQHRGDILWWKFEGIKLRLADNTFLTVDFPVLKADFHLEMRDVKGNWMHEDANAKIKIAAAMYPFRFLIVKKGKAGIWDMREI